MTRFLGVVGYSMGAQETPEGSGKYKQIVAEHPYSGDVKRVSRTLEDDDKVNSDWTIRNTIEIVADASAPASWTAIRYVMWDGVRWKVSNVDSTQRPRLILTVGEVWDGPTPGP